MRHFFALLLLLIASVTLTAQPSDHARADSLLRATITNLTPSSDATFGFTRTHRRLGHMSRPWMTWKRESAGSFMIGENGAKYYREDSVTFDSVYHAVTYHDDSRHTYVDYGESEPRTVSRSGQRDYVYEVAALTPVPLLRAVAGFPARGFIRYVRNDGAGIDTLVYRAEGPRIVALAIDRRGPTLRSAAITTADEMYGDVTATILYDDYERGTTGGFTYPTRITETMLGFEKNVVTVSGSGTPFDTHAIDSLLPSAPLPWDEDPDPSPRIERVGYDDRIHVLDLPQADGKALVVEFADFLVVADAPLTPANGEMIIAEAQRIAPGKPIRYFLFGHHHPHYLGGLRPFVHKGAVIISVASDTAYVRQLVDFPRTLEPDSLALEPRPLRMEVIDVQVPIPEGDGPLTVTTRVIADSTLEMRVIHIGTMSHHTDDYLIYYFPAQKLLVENDLVWIPSSGPVTAAGPRQKGLYDAIIKHDLDVDTIIQSWPVREHGVKTTFTFAELEESVKMMPAE